MGISGGSRRRIGWIAALLVAIGAGAWYLRVRLADDEPGIHVHPGLRTTWLDGPLRSDGTVDYVEFVRAERSRGVTPDNDLAPILSLCLERPLRGVLPATDRERPLAPVVSWFSWTIEHGIDDSGEPDAEYLWLSGRVDGSHADEIRKWLAEISPALDLIQPEARVRDRWFQPPEFNDLFCAGLTSSLKTLVPCYLMRAIGRDVGGDHAGAVEDLRSLFELTGRWRGWDGVAGLLSILACEGYVAERLAPLAERGTAWTCADFRRVDAAAPRDPRNEQLAELVPWERLAMLDMVVETTLDATAFERAERNMATLQQTMRETESGASGGNPSGPSSIDLSPDNRHLVAMPPRVMDHLLELVNDGFDARTSPMLRGDWETRIQTLTQLQRQASNRHHWIVHWDFWRRHTTAEDAASNPEAVAELIADLAIPLLRGTLESTVELTVAGDAARLRFALACFKNEFGRLPSDSEELVSACFDAPPRDRLYREPLGWTVGADGTIVVSSRGAPLADRLKAQHAKPR